MPRSNTTTSAEKEEAGGEIGWECRLEAVVVRYDCNWTRSAGGARSRRREWKTLSAWLCCAVLPLLCSLTQSTVSAEGTEYMTTDSKLAAKFVCVYVCVRPSSLDPDIQTLSQTEKPLGQENLDVKEGLLGDCFFLASFPLAPAFVEISKDVPARSAVGMDR